MDSNRPIRSRLEMAEEAAECRIPKWEMGEETGAWVPLSGRSVRVKVVLRVPSVLVRMMRPQRG